MVIINPDAPFERSTEPDGTKHAINGNIQVSVLPDAGSNVTMKYRAGVRQKTGEKSKWLMVLIDDLYIFVHGTHVVVTKTKLQPTFTTDDDESIISDSIKGLLIVKDEIGRYVLDETRARQVLTQALARAKSKENNTIVSNLRYAVNKVLSL